MEDHILASHSDSKLSYDRGREFFDKGDFQNSIIWFEKALSSSVHYKTAELLGECYLKQSDFEKAIIYLAAAVTLNKGVRAASLLAEAMVLSGDPFYADLASEFIELALTRDPRNRKALELKRRMEAEKGGEKG